MSDQHIKQSFRTLLHLLHASDVEAAERQSYIAREVQAILAALPAQPEADQEDVRAALYELGLLPERRSVNAQRDAAGRPRQTIVFEAERPSSRDQRQPRDTARWIGSWE